MWRCDTAFTVGETSWHKIQWGAVYCSASRRGRVFRGWKGAAERAGSVLYEKCKDDFEWPEGSGIHCIRWSQFAIYLAENT